MSGKKKWYHSYSYMHPVGTIEGWNWHLWHGSVPCSKCKIALERDLAIKRRHFIMRRFGNGRYV